MDSDGIALIALAVVLVGVITAVLLWARAKGQVRKKAIMAMIATLGFEKLKDQLPPKDFPLTSFPVVRWGEKGGRIFSMAARGIRNNREVLFFDYFLMQTPQYSRSVEAVVAQTIVAARGGKECFPTANSDPTLQLESAQGWTIAYRPTKILTAEEIQTLIYSIR